MTDPQIDEYRQQADDYRAAMLLSDKRIVDLVSQLAKMPRTRDGVLVVLGETVLYTKALYDSGYGDRIAHCYPQKLILLDGAIHVEGSWSGVGPERLPLSQCYGSESALLESEGSDEGTTS